MMLLLRCPHCRNQMRYESRDSDLLGKRKLCVYCGKGFAVRENLIAKL